MILQDLARTMALFNDPENFPMIFVRILKESYEFFGHNRSFMNPEKIWFWKLKIHCRIRRKITKELDLGISRPLIHKWQRVLCSGDHC